MLKEMTGEGCTIEDTDLLRRLRRKSAGALEEAVRQYGAYVMAVIRNRSRDVLTAEDQEHFKDLDLMLFSSVIAVDNFRQ